MKQSFLNKMEKKLEGMRAEIVESIRKRQEDENANGHKDVQDEGDMAQELSERANATQLEHLQKQRVLQIDAALRRIKDKTYGVCIDTEEDIDEDRLMANPLALRTLEAQEDFEKAQKEQRMRGGGVMSSFDGDMSRGGGDE